MKTYDEAIDYLFNQRPAFERQGAGGYKPGLQTTIALDNAYGNPHRKYKTIHVAGTNGKGSVSHLLAAVLQSQGYKVGLYTSPHFVDFAERIKVNGEPIPHNRVVEFVNDCQQQENDLNPSFFELTTILAFKYFAECDVDFAVIEVGLGGRLDSTNIITSIMSVITNISLDHTDFLGDTVADIAREKAGIMKAGVPVVIGEAHDELRTVFADCARTVGAQVCFAQDHDEIEDVEPGALSMELTTRSHGVISCQLTGTYQAKNALTTLTAINVLKEIGVKIDDSAVKQGFATVCTLTSFRGRWTVVNDTPLVVCDSGHNVAGLSCAMAQLNTLKCEQLHIVIGFMADKDVESVLELLPTGARYYFTQASTPRAMGSEKLAEMCQRRGLLGDYFSDVAIAYETAINNAKPKDVVYVGGSMYVLAEMFAHIDAKHD